MAAVVLGDADPLVKFCKEGDAVELTKLIKATKPMHRLEYINSYDRNGSTPLFHCVWPGHLDAMEVLLDYGANPNIQNNRLNTALHLACEREHKPLIQSLIEHGGDIEIKNWRKVRCWEVLEDEAKANDMKEFVENAHKVYMERMGNELNGKVTPEQRAYYKMIFDSIDTDEDGSLSYEELKPLLATMVEAPTEEEMHEFYDWFDIDHNSKVNFVEFLRGVLANVDSAAAAAVGQKKPSARDAQIPDVDSKAEIQKSISRKSMAKQSATVDKIKSRGPSRLSTAESQKAS